MRYLVSDFGHIGKLLILLGAGLIALGLVLLLAGRIPWIGRLPGDIVVRKKDFTFYFPLATSVIISVILSIIFWLLHRK